MSSLARPWQAGDPAPGTAAAASSAEAAAGATPKAVARAGRVGQPHGDADDRELLAAVARGERAALARLYERHGQRVFGYLLRQLGGDRPAAEEALQDVMLAIWKGAGAFRGESRVSTWMLGIAHRTALQERRRRERRRIPLHPGATRGADGDDAAGVRRVPGQAPDARQEAERRLAGAEIRRHLARLPQELRTVLELTLYQGLSTAEAGDLLGLPAGTVKSRLFRARARLRAALDEERGR